MSENENKETRERRTGPERRQSHHRPPDEAERRKQIGDRRRENNLRYATFKIGDDHFGIDVLRVQEVLLGQKATMVPLVNPSIQGLVNLRGQVVPIFNLRRILGYEAPDNAGETSDKEAGRDTTPQTETIEPVMAIINHGEGLLGFLFDVEDDYLEVNPSYFHPAPSHLDPIISDKVTGVCEMPGDLLIVLDVDAIFNSLQ